MKIKTRLYLNALVTMALIGCLVIVVFYFSRRMQEEVKNTQVANQLDRKIAELVLVTDEYLAYQYLRSFQQWLLKHEEIMRVTGTEAPDLYSAIQPNLESLHRSFLALRRVMDQKRRFSEEGGTKREMVSTLVLEERIIGRIRLDCNRILSDVFDFSEMAVNRLDTLHHRNDLTIIIVALVLFVLIATGSHTMIQKITRPLRTVVEGANRIEKGHMDHRIMLGKGHGQSASNNEMVELALSFNAMTEKLVHTIRDLKEMDQQQRAGLAEKEVLLQEVHHRVKNNMQVISSLLQLQGDRIQDPEARKVFNEARDRVKAMALTHESLYQSADMARIALGDYLDRLAGYLFRVHGSTAQHVRFKLNADRVFISLDRAVPCALVMSELISNALKHAFPAGRRGDLNIQVTDLGDGNIRIRVADNGAGLPAGFQLSRSEGLGLQLVRDIVEDQLDGSLEISDDGGAVFTVTFMG
jgi:two-component sensor histidine kinase